ncbi:AFR510Wp [Eremothecium gossypii ATCC 10895]|uniref:Glucosamine 6-phosphate N-acetyltransferase n=1 Tax=Eremothecium gossypii (strain ATCC 10895 / CBS 109.51 / FGSC 9923 / NRRL Y-1056) TaxID=284811 RepID=Q752R3_EREGS|nr:AFR510Wp [Eremothecium gossypii ATCC 10895]AAS53881.1 AFR510Wp [Eremothecium gossypii ATCC 10895]AEY98194.1 FAFR510Wp [Eremothecium gossypii FDAG1]
MTVLPEGYHIRRAEAGDYAGVIETLKVLTTVGDVTEREFAERIAYWKTVKVPVPARGKRPVGMGEILAYNPMVITDEAGRVVATGNIIIEAKLIHHCGLVGHIEDIAVASDQQGKRLGMLLINTLTEIGRNAGCYKIILDCDPQNADFYKKCGFSQAGLEMQHRFRSESKP